MLSLVEVFRVRTFAILKGQRGQSIIQVMVASAIMGILMTAIVSVQSSQSQENRALGEKMGALDLQRSITVALADGAVCMYLLANTPANTFDSTKLPQTITLAPPLYSSVVAGVPGPILAQVGSAPSIIANSLIVKSIGLTITAGAANTYNGNLNVNWDNTKMVRPINPAAGGVILTVDVSNPTSAKITGCMGNGGAAAPCWQQAGVDLYETCATKVGVGGYTTPQYELDAGPGTVQAQSFLYSSDARLKTGITTLDGYSLARKLRGVAFTWKSDQTKDVGLIAQEVQKVVPELVRTDKNGMMSVKYANLTAILIEAFKTQDEKMDEMSVRLRALEEKLGGSQQ
ncbi:MAG: tail fiber domain-containing protein [Bdellovibrionales bacterium]